MKYEPWEFKESFDKELAIELVNQIMCVIWRDHEASQDACKLGVTPPVNILDKGQVYGLFRALREVLMKRVDEKQMELR